MECDVAGSARHAIDSDVIGSAGDCIESNAAGETTAGIIVAGNHGQGIDGIASINAEGGVKIASNRIENKEPAVGWSPTVPNRVSTIVAVVVRFVEFLGRADIVAAACSSH